MNIENDPLAQVAAAAAPVETPKPKTVKARRPALKKRKAKTAPKRKPAIKAKVRKPKARKMKTARKAKSRRKPGAVIGRPRVSKWDTIKLIRTGKNDPRPGTARATIASAFGKVKGRTIGSAIEGLASGFKPPRINASAVRENPGKYFRLAIVLMVQAGILKKVK